MKKIIAPLLAIVLIMLAGCVTEPAAPRPVRLDRDIHVEIIANGPLVLMPRDAGGPFQAINGIVGETIEPKDVIIHFRNEFIREDIKPGTPVNWISNMPQGLKAQIREAKRNSGKITITVEGEPRGILNEQMRFNIPGTVFSRGQNVNFTSDEAKFEILQGSLNLADFNKPPAAAVNYVYISGSVGLQLNPVSLKVTLTGTELKSDIEKEIPVDLVVNAPEGLEISVQPAAAGATILFLSVEGTPTEAKNEAVKVEIPARLLGDVENFKVPNEVIQWHVLGGSIADVLIDGSVDSAIISKDIKLTLLGAVFAEDMAPGASVNWITNLPSGLSARVKQVRAKDSTGIITVSGTPLAISTDTVAMSIPSYSVVPGADLPVISNVYARFAINNNTRQISVTEVSGGSSNPNWIGVQRGPLNVPILPAVKDFQGVGLVSVKATSVEQLGADNQYHWTGQSVNYGMLIEAAQKLDAHAIINVVVDYNDSVEYREVIRELAPEHEWSDDELDKIARGILYELVKDEVRYSVERSHIITRTYIGSALAIRYVNGLEYYEAEQLRSMTPARVDSGR